MKIKALFQKKSFRYLCVPKWFGSEVLSSSSMKPKACSVFDHIPHSKSALFAIFVQIERLKIVFFSFLLLLSLFPFFAMKMCCVT